MTIKEILTLTLFSGVESSLKEAIRIINLNKVEFEDYKKFGSKLQAVKSLKDYTGYGLKECKEVCDLYFVDKLPNIKEERLVKLERLAKSPLVNQMVIKLKDLNENDLFSLLMKMQVDELLVIDEYLNNDEIIN